MEYRGGGDPSVSGFGTDSFEAVLQSTDERSARWSGVAGVHDPSGLVEVDLGNSDEVFDGLDESRSIGSVGKGSSMALPSVLKHLSAWINELDTVILWFVPLNATRGR